MNEQIHGVKQLAIVTQLVSHLKVPSFWPLCDTSFRLETGNSVRDSTENISIEKGKMMLKKDWQSFH